MLRIRPGRRCFAERRQVAGGAASSPGENRLLRQARELMINAGGIQCAQNARHFGRALLMLAACSSTPETRAGRAGGAGRTGSAGRTRRHRLEKRPAGIAAGSRSERRRPRVLRFRPLRHHAGGAGRLWRGRPIGCGAIRMSRSRSKGIATSAARASTIWRSASAAPRRPRMCWSRWESRQPDLDDQLRQGTAGGRRVERGGLRPEPARRDHRQLKREPPARLPAGRRALDHPAMSERRPFFALNGPY